MSLAQASCTLAYLPGSAAYLLSVTGCDCQGGSGNYATLVVWQAKKLLQIPQATASGNKVISSWKPSSANLAIQQESHNCTC